jgi:hypothetical protein
MKHRAKKAGTGFSQLRNLDHGLDGASPACLDRALREAFRACLGKVDPLFRQGHASQVFELARILFDQVIPPDRNTR